MQAWGRSKRQVLLSSLIWWCAGIAGAGTADKAVETVETLLPVASPCENNPDKSCHEKKVEEVKLASDNPSAIGLYRPQFLLPVFYTSNHHNAVYAGHTPNKQTLNNREVKGQISFQVPIAEDLFHLPLDIVGAYTQTFYWQVYLKSAFFRETNYEPEFFARVKLDGWGFANVGISHQSNGQGGTLERSWNRAYVDLQFSSNNFYVSVKPWFLIFASQSADLYNSDIARYMGRGSLVIAYKTHDFIASLLLRNHLESNFRRGSEEVTLSLPRMKRFRFYLQAFRGYGQSMIEYNHSNRGFGVGLAMNDWL